MEPLFALLVLLVGMVWATRLLVPWGLKLWRLMVFLDRLVGWRGRRSSRRRPRRYF